MSKHGYPWGLGLESIFPTQVHPDIKLPVLYLVDSIIKNVGGAYTQKFSQSIVNMFTRTFKQVIIHFDVQIISLHCLPLISV